MRIIPAIDIIDGKCVRLTKGDYNTKKIYNENPLEVAKEFEDNGIKYLHLVDLDGAKSKHIVNHNILESIASKTNLKVDFGGGLKSNDDLRIAFECGANQITGGSIAANNPELFLKWLAQYGADKIILGADCNNEKIAISGWLEESELDIFVSGNGEFGFLMYMILFGLLYNIGKLPFFDNQKLRRNGYIVLGSLGTIYTLMLTSFEWLWQDVLRHDIVFNSQEFYISIVLFLISLAENGMYISPFPNSFNANNLLSITLLEVEVSAADPKL